MSNNEIHILLREDFSDDDCETMIFLGVWEDPHMLMEYYNEVRKHDFIRLKNSRKTDGKTIDIKYAVSSTNETVVTLRTNSPCKFNINHLDFIKTNDDHKILSVDEFFIEHKFPKLWTPDPYEINEFNKQIREKNAKKYEGESLKQKMTNFRKLFKELQENGVLEGEFFMIKDEDDKRL